MSQAWDLKQALERTGVLIKGHFLLSSGRHSKQYMQCAQMLQHPKEAEEAGKLLGSLFQDIDADVVVSPALGGVIIGYEVARALQIRSVFTERKEGKMELRRGFSIQPYEKVIIIEDVVTTGRSMKEVIHVLEEQRASIVGVGALVDRSQGKVSLPYPYRTCISIESDSFESLDCPLCKEGIPITKPGSRQLKVMT